MFTKTSDECQRRNCLADWYVISVNKIPRYLDCMVYIKLFQIDCQNLLSTCRRQQLTTSLTNLLQPDEVDIDRGPLAKIFSFRGTHVGNTWFMVYLKDI